MKGIIFNLLEAMVISDNAEDMWDQLLTARSLDVVYLSLGSYPDEQIQKLVGAASHLLWPDPVRSPALVGSARFSKGPGSFSRQCRSV
jgi:hypothetical protein